MRNFLYFWLEIQAFSRRRSRYHLRRNAEPLISYFCSIWLTLKSMLFVTERWRRRNRMDYFDSQLYFRRIASHHGLSLEEPSARLMFKNSMTLISVCDSGRISGSNASSGKSQSYGKWEKEFDAKWEERSFRCRGHTQRSNTRIRGCIETHTTVISQLENQEKPWIKLNDRLATAEMTHLHASSTGKLLDPFAGNKSCRKDSLHSAILFVDILPAWKRLSICLCIEFWWF